MAKVFEVRDEVWEAVEPLLPEVEAAVTGRPRVPDRVAFNAIVFALVTAITRFGGGKILSRFGLPPTLPW